LDRLVKIRPDPSRENDLIRLTQARLYYGFGNETLAQAKIVECFGKLTMADRLKLGFASFYVSKRLVFGVLGLFIISVVGLLILKFRKQELVKNKNESTVDAKMAFANNNITNPRYREYLNCLQSLGLDGKASLNDIKRAFRKAVKQAHPDKRRGEGGKASDEFVSITRAYEQALNLREQLKLG
jgi:hypothetical protein